MTEEIKDAQLIVHLWFRWCQVLRDVPCYKQELRLSRNHVVSNDSQKFPRSLKGLTSRIHVCQLSHARSIVQYADAIYNTIIRQKCYTFFFFFFFFFFDQKFD